MKMESFNMRYAEDEYDGTECGMQGGKGGKITSTILEAKWPSDIYFLINT